MIGRAMPADPDSAASRAAAIQIWKNWPTTDFGGGPGPVRLTQAIEFQLAGTPGRAWGGIFAFKTRVRGPRMSRDPEWPA